MSLSQSFRTFLDSRLQPSYLSVGAGSIVGLACVLAFSLFITSKQGQTAFGIPLGADFAGFYVAADILNQGQERRLYDRKLHHEMYHQLLPLEDDQVAIPYIHPPFVAGMLKPIAKLPYPVAFAFWLVISVILYVAGTAIILNSLPWPDRRQVGLVILLACSFEPFAFECWLGGQLSAVGYFSFALCFAALQRSLPFWAGVALGICFYKPTLLILPIPMLVIGKRWGMLLGMTATGIGLVLLSILFVGWNINVSYLGELLSFNKSSSGGDLEIRVWKYVDLNNSLRLMLDAGSPWQRPLFLLAAMIPFSLLAVSWWNSDKASSEYRQLLWATTLSWTPILNLYVGIYDSILVVQSLLITAALICHQFKGSRPLLESDFAYLILAISLAPWFSQNLAHQTGFPFYTVLVMGLGSFQLGRLFCLRSQVTSQ